MHYYLHYSFALCLHAMETATAQPPHKPPQPMIIIIICTGFILFYLLVLCQIGIAFLTLKGCQNDRHNDADEDAAPAKGGNFNAGISSVTLFDVVDRIGYDHEAQYHDRNDLKHICPPFSNAEIGEAVRFLTQGFGVEEPTKQEDFQNTAAYNTDVINEGIDNIQNIESGAGLNSVLITIAGLKPKVVAFLRGNSNLSEIPAITASIMEISEVKPARTARRRNRIRQGRFIAEGC